MSSLTGGAVAVVVVVVFDAEQPIIVALSVILVFPNLISRDVCRSLFCFFDILGFANEERAHSEWCESELQRSKGSTKLFEKTSVVVKVGSRRGARSCQSMLEEEAAWHAGMIHAMPSRESWMCQNTESLCQNTERFVTKYGKFRILAHPRLAGGQFQVGVPSILNAI